MLSRLARFGRPSVFRRFSVSTSSFSSKEAEPAAPSAAEDTSSAFPSRNERDVKSREFEDWLSGLSGIEFVRQATATGEMPKDTVGHGMPRVWSESVLNSSIGRTNAGQWPYSVANKTKYPTVAAVFTSKSNPVEHTVEEAAAGTIYSFPEKVEDMFPEGLAGQLSEHFKLTKDHKVLIPPAGPEFVQRLEKFRTSKGVQLPPFRLINGPRGSGKSALLNYIVHYCRSNDWLCVFIPNTFEIIHGGKVLTPSRTTPGMVDQHDIAANLLKTTLHAHKDQLSQLTQQGTYPKNRYLPADLDAVAVADRDKRVKEEQERRRRLKAEAEAAGKKWDASALPTTLPEELDTNIDRSSFTLADMVAWGARHPQFATDTFLDFKKELASVTKFPVMIAIDGIDNLYEAVTEYPNEGAMLTPEQLSIPNALRVFDADGFKQEHVLKRGMVIASTCYHHCATSKVLQLVSVPKKQQLTVEPLSRLQTHALLTHFHQTNNFLMLQDDVDITPDAVEFYRMLSGGIASEIVSVAVLH